MEQISLLWPEAHLQAVTSEYERDAESIRVQVNETMFVDLTQMSGRWVFIVGADGVDLQIPPASRVVQEIPGLSMGATPKQVATVFVDAMRKAWNGIIGFQRDLETSAAPDFQAIKAELDNQNPEEIPTQVLTHDDVEVGIETVLGGIDANTRLVGMGLIQDGAWLLRLAVSGQGKPREIITQFATSIPHSSDHHVLAENMLDAFGSMGLRYWERSDRNSRG